MENSIENRAPEITRTHEVLYDYGKIYRGVAPYDVSYPDSLESVQRLVRANPRRPLRVRGSGHTFNGCTLPQAGEILLRTDRLNHFLFDERGTIRCGAGALVWDARDLMADYGYRMPVFNGGWAGPTLGGYLNAGGFGKGNLSSDHGGFWENVLEITLVDGLGDVHRIGREDPEFRWLFGGFGQLGVVVELKLAMKAEHPLAGLTYPNGREGTIPNRQAEDPKLNDTRLHQEERILFWFSLLVRLDQEEQAWRDMLEFCIRQQDVVMPDGGWAGPVHKGDHIGYRYDIRFKNFNPPLVFPFAEDFIVMGVMTFLDVSIDDSAVKTLEQNFVDLADQGDYQLYLQAENIGRNVDFRDYFGPQIHDEFERLKVRFDPRGIINPGFFSS